MTLRILPTALILPSLCLAALPAQDAKAQDPDIATQSSAARSAEELQKEKDRLVQEISYVRELLAKGGLAARVANKLESRFLEPRVVDAGSSKEQLPAVGFQPKKATLMTEEQKKMYLDDVIFLVEGRPVRQAVFDELLEYLKSVNPEADENGLKTHVLMELIKTEYAHGHFAESATQAADTIREFEAALGRGVEFESIAKNRSQHPSADQGGDLGYLIPNSGHPLKLEQLAFSTEVGKVSPIFRTSLGFNLLRVSEVKEADSGRAVRVSLILVPYHDAFEEVQELQRSVSLGQVDLAFRDEALRQVLPPMYR